MSLTEQDINRIITWCKLHKFKYNVSERGHMVTVTSPKNTVQWWPLRNRAVFDGRTKKAVKACTMQEFLELVASRWCAE